MVTVLKYKGPVDYKMIDILLMKLKSNEAFASIGLLTRKRTYAVVVECLENISRHSRPTSSDIPEMQPSIFVSKNENKISVIAGNPVPDESKNRLTNALKKINKLNEKELKVLYIAKINREWRQDDNGAGLGFISMAIKSENRISFSFNPLVIGYSYFEMQIILMNKT